MNLNAIPAFIRDSGLTPEELDLLLVQERMPTDEEIDAIRFLPDIQELCNAFIGDETSRGVHLVLKARQYLAVGDSAMALKVLLL